jgi:hypothetical protein
MNPAGSSTPIDLEAGLRIGREQVGLDFFASSRRS